MKKNVLLVASVAGLVFLTSTATFAASTNSTSRAQTNVSHTIRNGSGRNLGFGMKMGSGVRIDSLASAERMGIRGGEGRGIGMGGMFGAENDTGRIALMDAMRTAIESNDYSAYSTTYDKAKMTTTQFAEAVKMHTSRTAMDTALTNKDYSAFLTAIKGTPIEGQVTQAQFTEMTTRHANMPARPIK